MPQLELSINQKSNNNCRSAIPLSFEWNIDLIDICPGPGALIYKVDIAHRFSQPGASGGKNLEKKKWGHYNRWETAFWFKLWRHIGENDSFGLSVRAVSVPQKHLKWILSLKRMIVHCERIILKYWQSKVAVKIKKKKKKKKKKNWLCFGWQIKREKK